MDISLIIPIYNQIYSLECVLESIRFIKYPFENFEVIIVDDGSSDPLQELVWKYQKDFHLKYIRHENNQGRSAARNTGVNESTGKILIFSDGDRLLSPGFFMEHKKHISNNNVCIGKVAEIFKQVPFNDMNKFVGDVISGNNSIIKFIFNYGYQEIASSIFNDAGKNISSIPWISLLSGNFSIMKSVFENTGGFDVNFKSWGLENIEFGYRLFKSGVEFVYNENAVNYHLYHESNRNPKFMENNILYFYQKHQDENILKYYKFLSGDISLNAIDNSLKQVIFNSSKIGTRYKRG